MPGLRFTSFDDTQIAYQRWTPADGSPVRSPPVLLHHGFAVDADINWVGPKVVERLVADGFDVIGIDARGHGASEKPLDPTMYGEDLMARDVAALADHLGLDEFDLVGYSMGGIVATVVACQEPRLRRVVVGGVGASVVELGGVDTRAVTKEDIVAALLADDPDSVTDPGPRAFRELADATGADRHALAAQATSIRQGPLPLEDIRALTLVVVGDDDVLAERPEVLASGIGARLVTVPGDHMTAVGHPDFADAISTFLTDDLG